MQKSKIMHKLMTRTGILLFLLIVYSCERTEYDLLDPQSAGVWTVFDTSDGLPGNQVADIKRDSKGNLWFTFPGQGIAKFNDNGWTYYRTANSNLLNNSVNCLDEDANGDIIFGTVAGLSILSTTNSWDSYLDPVSTMVVQTIKVAGNGAVWVGTSNQGFYVNRGTGFEKTLSDAYKTVNVIEEDSDGNIWIGTDNGLIKWNGSAFSYLSSATGLPNNKVSSMFRDAKKRLWVGTRGGKTVSWIDNTGLHQLSLLNGRDSCFVNDIFEDRRGDIWFATDSDGLIRYDGIIPHSYKIDNGFPENTIRSIGEDKDGNLWFGLKSKGVVRYTLPIN